MISRREFLEKTGAAALGILASTHILAGHTARLKMPRSGNEVGYGPLKKDRRNMLDLPSGFKYKLISKMGDKMDDGYYVPGLADGMATFSGPNDTTIVVINHEYRIGNDESIGPFKGKKKLLENFDQEKIYDLGNGTPCLGSVTTLVYDTKKQKRISRHLSLVGTLANCGVAPTPWGSALICEECTEIHMKRHGYAFEVPVSAKPEIIKPEPLRTMGRFKREGSAIDPKTGIVYQTEDQVDGLFYRFIADNPQNLSGRGRLQCLAVIDRPKYDTRNWKVQKTLPGEVLAVHWIDLENVDTDKDDLRMRGHSLGAALLASGEGIFQHADSIYISCTNGGIEAKGQIWKYIPSPYEGTEREAESPGRLELFVEPNDPEILDHPDQLTVAPTGDIFVCEDGDDEQYMVGITPEKKFYKFAHNAFNNTELSGVCFSPDGTTMFVNLLAAGLTFAITGPWS